MKEKGENKVNYLAVAAFVISLLSAAWTVYSSYRTDFSAFDLRMTVGHPMMAKSSDAKNELYSLTPIIPLEFLNLGAKAGEVRDIVIVVSAGSARWLLQAELICKTFSEEAMKEEFREVVHPFILNGKERLFRSILFNPGGQPIGYMVPMMRPNESLPEGTYVFEYYVNAGDDNELKLVAVKKYDMPKNIVKELAMDKGGTYLPFDESMVEARETLEQKLSKKNNRDFTSLKEPLVEQ